MTARNFARPIVLTIILASAGYSQTPTAQQDREQPDFSVHVWGYIVEDFSARVAAYSELRSEIEKGLPILAALPALPGDIQYRFVGGNLILLDVRAGVILDRIPDAIDMKDCRKAVSEK